MNRRRFLAGLGAAVATLATVTRLGETRVLPASPRIADYLTDPDAWYIRTTHELVPSEALEEIGETLSEESLERVLVAARRYCEDHGVPIRVRPTHVIYGS